MKTSKTLALLALCAGAATTGAWAQAFSSGSDGSYGPMDITANTTLDLPPDGVFNATTITIASGATLSFNRNALNTPVYLLATGDVEISGDINVNGGQGNNVVGGLGGPGGFNGGNPASVSTPPGDGYGPGAGRLGTGGQGDADVAAGPAGHATVGSGVTTNKGSAYGSALLIPMVGGSGGGGTYGTPGYGGGAGGGAILIASDTQIQLPASGSEILARGGGSLNSAYKNGGSGGAIRLIAPLVFGSGALRVDGLYSGGAGRIRIDTLDRSQLGFSLQPSGVASIGSLMTVFPTPIPRLDIIEVAGTAIAAGTPAVFTLPFGSSTSRTVIVRATDFNDVVPISVVLTPDNGAAVTYEAEIDNTTANPAQVTVNVELPVNVQTTVSAWTR